MDGIDIAIPLGPGSKFRDAELRYFLRSVEKFCTGYRRIFVIGRDPKFLNPALVKHVPCAPFNTNKEARIALKFLRLFETVKDVSDEVLMANDDYAFVRPTDIRKIPSYQKGRLLASSQPRRVIGKKKPERTSYQHILRRTHDALVEAGLPAFHYDIHVPIKFDKKRFIALKPWWERSRKVKNGFVMKSVYANNVFSDKPGPRMSDCKFGSFKDEKRFQRQIAGRWVISYNDMALGNGLIHALHRRFPDLSKFEKN